MDIIYDTECFPNCFLLCAKEAGTRSTFNFEISSRRNDSAMLMYWLTVMKESNNRMVGFNNVGFDYPLLHGFINGLRTPQLLYEKTVALIGSEDKFAHIIWPSDRFIPQIDLLRVHHFDNKARMTSLKALEFNMRLDNISDLPFPPNTVLTSEQMDVLKAYCFDDVDATEAFYNKSLDKIHFREQLSMKYHKDFLNHSDVKIGKEIFQIKLEDADVPCFEITPTGKRPRQTLRTTIKLEDCIPLYVRFEHPEFERVRKFLSAMVINQTKGAFDLTATVGGIDFKFGTGGIHGSVENEAFVANDEWMIYDVDVTSLYPSIAIENNYYPEHLGPKFVEVYRSLREQRMQYGKKTAENAMLKLALNGVYGASNDPYSCFYDSRFTMQITITGQMLVAMLAEQLLSVPEVRIIQCNTDGITLFMPRRTKFLIDAVCRQWEHLTQLSLEYVEFSKMVIADVNSYLAQKVNGEVKRKGRYEYELDWNKDASALVVPKVAEKVLLEGASMTDLLASWPDKMDFMLRAKVNKGSRLVLAVGSKDIELDRTQRYYVSTTGGNMFKIMPPLAKKPDQWRRMAVQLFCNVTPCNDINDATAPIDFRWYANEVDKLVLGVL